MSKLLRNDNRVSLEEEARILRERQASRAARALVVESGVAARRQRLAETLYELSPELQPWNGDPFTLAEALERNMHRAKLAYAQADAVIALDDADG